MISDLGRPYVELARDAFDRNEITPGDVSGCLEVKVNNPPRLEHQLRGPLAEDPARLRTP